MRKYFLNHALQYAIILLILLTGLVVAFSPVGRLVKLSAVVGLAALYFIWGVWHHWEDHEEITLATVVEYTLVAILILWVLLAVS